MTLTIGPGQGAAAFTSSTSVGIAVGSDTFLTPGFEHNRIETIRCTITLDGELITVIGFFTPPTP